MIGFIFKLLIMNHKYFYGAKGIIYIPNYSYTSFFELFFLGVLKSFGYDKPV